jgi:hypothetical protein
MPNIHYAHIIYRPYLGELHFKNFKPILASIQTGCFYTSHEIALFFEAPQRCFKNTVFILLMKLHQNFHYAIDLYDLPICVSFSTR